MSSRWHFRIDGHDAGPVEFAELQQLAAELQLLGHHEVRAEDSDRWVPVATVPSLLPDPADEDDLASMLADNDTNGAAEDRADEHDLASMLAQHGTNGEAEDRAQSAKNCYFRVHMQQMGPMPFEMLVGLARLGRLGRHDQVRIGDDSEWVEAHSVAGLFGEATAAPIVDDEATRAAAAMLDSLEIVPDPTPRKPRTRRREHVPAIRMTDDDGSPPVVALADGVTTGEHDQWYCRILGQELGPIPWDELKELVKTRQLGPNDRVRKGETPLWVPASMIDDLFPSRKQMAAKAAHTSHVAPQRGIGSAEAKPAATPIQRTPQTGRFFVPPTKTLTAPPTPVSATPAATPKAAAQAVPDVAAPASGRSAAAAAPSAPPARVAPAPPPPTPKYAAPSAPKFSMPSAPKISMPKVSLPKVSLPRPSLRIGNPFRGLGGAIGGMVSSMGSAGAGGLAGQWKTLVAAAVLFAVAGAMVFGLPRSRQRDREIYADTARMWDQAQKLKEGSRPIEWDAFRTVAKPQSLAITTELTSMPTEEDRLLKLLLECHRDCLQKILSGSPKENAEVWSAMGRRMDEAKTLAGTE